VDDFLAGSPAVYSMAVGSRLEMLRLPPLQQQQQQSHSISSHHRVMASATLPLKTF